MGQDLGGEKMIRKAIRKWLGIEPEKELAAVEIPVKYFTDEYVYTPLKYTGDWVDVRACNGVEYFHTQSKSWVLSDIKIDLNGKSYIDLYPNELVKIPLGFAMKLPRGYEAIVKVRSSTSKNTGLLMATSGVIDEGYSGPNDQWFAVMHSTRSDKLYLGERIAQFRVQEKQPRIFFEGVCEMHGPDRGGHGSTGRH